MKLTITCYSVSWQPYYLYSTGCIPLSEGPQLSDTSSEKNVQLLPLLLSLCLDFTVFTRSCFLAAQVYSIFSGRQFSAGLFFLENENTHPFEVVLNYSIQCNLHGLCLLDTYYPAGSPQAFSSLQHIQNSFKKVILQQVQFLKKCIQ